MARIGILSGPEIFGRHVGLFVKAWRLRRIHCLVKIFSLYKGQRFSPPFFPWLLAKTRGNNERILEEINKLALRFDDDMALYNVRMSIRDLTRAGCDTIVLWGFGMSGIYFLKYAENLRRDSRIKLVVAAYPHLIFPPDHRIDKRPPALEKITCRTVLFFGEEDTNIEPGTIQLALNVAAQRANIKVFVYPNAGHAFGNAFAQGCIPNPLWFSRGARIASQASWAKGFNYIKTLNVLNLLEDPAS